MTFSEVCIRRPVLASVMSLLIFVFGIMAFIRLGVREYPAVDAPVVTVRANYSGADPELIDTQITEVLEQALSGISGIKNISSTSREGSSDIRVEFDLDVDIEVAANDVRDKISGAVRRLPDDADPPTVEKADSESQPIIFLAVQSDRHNNLEISHYADAVIKERLQTIPGVSAVRIWGERRYAMRLWLDPERMAAHGITPLDVSAALRRENVDLPSGRVEGRATELSLRTDGRLLTEEDFSNLVLKQERGRPVRMRDVGRAELSAEDLRRGNYSEGLPMIACAIIPQPNTNAVAIADEFYKRFEQLERELPDGFQLVIGYDFTKFVRRSIVEVRDTLVIAFILVALIIYAFLRDWRTVLIPLISIPVSLMAGFFIMDRADFSINVLTLMGLVLAIGLVVDDAIVVLENIHTKVEEGLGPFEAAVAGTREIYFAVISTTCALAAVFTPILFLDGLTGKLFQEFGVVIVGCVIVSSFVALTLTPSLGRLLIRPSSDEGLLYRITEPVFVLMNRVYRATLSAFLLWPVVLFPVLGVTIVTILWAHDQLPTELAPFEDRSNIRVVARGPEGASYEFAAESARRIAEDIEAEVGDDLHRAFAITGRPTANSSFINVYLKEPHLRDRGVEEINEQVSEIATRSRNLRAFPSMPPTIGDRRGGQPLRFVLKAPTLERMQEILPEFIEKASEHPDLRFVDADLKMNTPQLRVLIDRPRAAELGVDIQEAARAIQLTFGETRLGYFNRSGRQYQIIGQLQRSERDKPSDISRVHVRTRSGELVPLSSVVTTEETASPAAVYRHDRFIAATVSGSLAPGKTLGDGIAAMRSIAAQVLPPDFQTDLAGQSKDFEESSSSLVYAFLAAILLVYLVLAAQFESWLDPFIILLTVPLSLGGALLSLHVFGQSLNIFSQIGIIMLVGLVTKNGILIVEFANQRKRTGLSPHDAVIDAAAARLRPILMTSLSTILGILPIAMSLGSGSGSRQSLGIAVVGGMTLASALTLYIVPAVYAFLSPAFDTLKARAYRDAPPPPGHEPAGQPALAEG